MSSFVKRFSDACTVPSSMFSRTVSFFSLTLFLLFHPALLLHTSAVDFGRVFIGKDGPDQDWVISNPSSSENATFTIEEPTDPFAVRSGAGSLSGTLGPSGSATVTFGFTAPERLGKTEASFQLTLHVTITPGQGSPIMSAVTLSATAYGPYPVNAQKVRSAQLWFVDSSRLATEVTFRSSTGVITDLAKIEIREILFYSLTPFEPKVPLPEYPNFCQTSQVPQVQEPSPWIVGGTLATPVVRPYPSVNQLVGGSKDPPRLNSEGVAYAFEDYHEIGSLGSLGDGTYSISQFYQWTAPYMKDAIGCKNWTFLAMGGSLPAPLTDTITREITRVNGRWVCKITSQRAGERDFDLGVASASLIPGLGPTAVIRLTWPALGSMLQVATRPNGPWENLVESILSNEIQVPATAPGGQGQFFRVVPPP